MPRPAVLIVEPRAERRRELSRGLTLLGYEVVPAVDEEQGRLFAAQLPDAVVVAPLDFLPDESAGATTVAPRQDSAKGLRWLLLGDDQDQAQDLPSDVAFLAGGALDAADVVRRVHVLLLGREVGIEPDEALRALVGDLALIPFLELLRTLERATVSGRVSHAAGEVTLLGGQVVRASAGAARGVKAFCRLSHLGWGPVRIEPRAEEEAVAGTSARGAGDGGESGDSLDSRQAIDVDTRSLIILALEDRVHDAPDRRTRVRLDIGRDFFERAFTPAEKEVLAAMPSAPAVGALLDALPATDGEILRTLAGLVAQGVVRLEEDRGRVAVVTDSTCDLSPELARAHGLQVVPLLVIFGDRIFHDGIDLGARDFYDKLEGGAASPRTNPPPRSDFLAAYRGLPAGQDVLSLHVSEKLSQTIVNAREVAAEVRPELAARAGRQAKEPAPAVTVLDSASISLGLGLQALFAARMARRGLDLAAISQRVEVMRDRMHVLFVVDTLDYLVRGGRIGKARAALGKMLGVKPILGIAEGEVVSVDRVRGGRAAHPRLADLFAKRVDIARPVVVAIGHAKAPIWADRLRGLLQQRFTVSELIVTEIGPVVGTHAGPGTVGAAVFQPTEDEAALVAPLEEPA